MSKTININYLVMKGSRPKLTPPTISYSSKTLTIKNDTTKNGTFVKKYKLYNRDGFLKEITYSSASQTFDLSTLPVGEYKINVRAIGDNFEESEPSNEITYSNYKVLLNLKNITSSNTNGVVYVGGAFNTTFTAESGYYLPSSIDVLYVDGSKIDYTYNASTGKLSIPIIKGNLYIYAIASTLDRLATPVITLNDETHILSWNSVENAEKYGVFANGKRIALTSLTSVNLQQLLSVDVNIYKIYVIAYAKGYQESVKSETVDYYRNVMVYGISGLSTTAEQLTRTYDNVGKSYVLNSSSGVYSTDFDEIFPEEYVGDDLQKIFFNDGSMTWVDETGQDYTGNVFRKINKFYKRVILNSSNYRDGFDIAIAKHKPDGFYCPAYFTNIDGSEMEYILIGVYGCYKNTTDKCFESKSGKTHFVGAIWSTEVPSYFSYHDNDKLSYFCADWRVRQLFLDLFMLIFATRNDDAIMPGPSCTYGDKNTGLNNELRPNGQFCYNTKTGMFNFLGIENFMYSPVQSSSATFANRVWFNGVKWSLSSSPRYIRYSMNPFNGLTDESNSILASYTPTYGSSSRYLIASMGYDESCPDIEFCVRTTSTNDAKNAYSCEAPNSNFTGVGFATTKYYSSNVSFQNNTYGLFYNSNVVNNSGSNTYILCAQPKVKSEVTK